MRYHVGCDGALGAGAWLIQTEQGAGQFRIHDAHWSRNGTFAVVDAQGASPTEARPRRTWRHRMFDLFRCGELVAVVRTSLRSGIRAECVWEMPGPDTLELRGEFAELNYRFVRGVRTVGVVSTLEEREGSFRVEVVPFEDQGLILTAALAVRCLCAELGAAQPRLRRVRSESFAMESGSRESEVRVAG